MEGVGGVGEGMAVVAVVVVVGREEGVDGEGADECVLCVCLFADGKGAGG